MKYLRIWLKVMLLLGVLILCLLISCSQQRQQEARSGLDISVDDLPNPDNFDVIKVIYKEFTASEGQETCYYARAHAVLGSSLSEQQAISTYVQGLLLLNWELGDRQYENTKTLTRGTNERIVIRSGPPGIDIEESIDYADLQEKYETIIFIDLNYMLPTMPLC